MSWTKRQIINQAFEDAGLASFVFDLTADQIQSALRRLDSLMATWNAKGISFPYPIASSGSGSDPDQDSGLPDYAIPAAYMALAVQLCPSFGKVPAVELKVAAKQAYDALLSIACMPREMQIGAMPAGFGNKSPDVPFLNPADTSPVQIGGNGNLVFGD